MKRSPGESLERKLLRYSVVAAAILIEAKEAKAQVSYVQMDTTIHLGTHLIIDFNGSVKFEVRELKKTTSTSSKTSKTYRLASILNETAKAGFIPVSAKSKARPKALSSNYVVSSKKNFETATLRVGRAFVSFSSHGTSGKSFVGADKFLGVRFKTSADTGADSSAFNYGWIELHVYSKVDSMEVIGYAFQETSNTPIKAGQTTDVSLPVEMAAFTAENVDDEVQLKWSTASEVNLKGFEVQRSMINAQRSTVIWNDIGYVKGDGTNTSQTDYSFIDRTPLNGDAEYRLKVMDTDGSYKYSPVITVTTVPTKFELMQNYPNPFNPTTNIRYALPKAEHVVLKVYNELGQDVATLVDEEQQPGEYTATFDGSNLASGVYFYEISAGDFRQVKKLMLIK